MLSQTDLTKLVKNDTVDHFLLIRNIEVKWVHVIIKNRGFRRAEQCNGYILKIKKN